MTNAHMAYFGVEVFTFFFSCTINSEIILHLMIEELSMRVSTIYLKALVILKKKLKALERETIPLFMSPFN